VGRLIAGGVLLLLSLFMLLGFFQSGVALGAPTTIFALLVAVGVPGAAGVALLAGKLGYRKQLAGRKEQLRLQTLDAEILRLAGKHNGKLTLVEVVSELAITPETAKQALDAMHGRELAEIEITESGVLVYAFHDVQRVGEKPHSKGILDA